MGTALKYGSNKLFLYHSIDCDGGRAAFIPIFFPIFELKLCPISIASLINAPSIFIRMGNFGIHILRVKRIGQGGSDIDLPCKYSSTSGTSFTKDRCLNILRRKFKYTT